MSLEQLIEQCLGGAAPLAMAEADAQRWDAWLQPIHADNPAGEDPTYDDDFQTLREEVNKLSGADTAAIVRSAEQLLTRRCKDLRVATYYLWARLQQVGEAGLADGLGLLAALLARYGEQVLPLRPNSRQQALQWLAGAKVLDALARFPEVAKPEAARTVAALAWLEQGVGAWPAEQRPALGGLYSALGQRLAHAGGADALVPQTQASPAPRAQAEAAIASGRDLLDGGRRLAAYLYEQPHGWLAAHRLMKTLRWDTLQQPPPQDANGLTRLAPPRGELRAQLQRLQRQRLWAELLEQADRAFGEGVNHFWLDLQAYQHQALAQLPAPQASWAPLVRHDLAMLLERLPGLEALCWSDGTPFADDATRQWLSEQVLARPAPPLLNASAAAAPAQWELLEQQALAQADSDGADAALAWLAEQPGLHSGRQRWWLRLLMARVAEQCGRAELALHLLGELEASAQALQLAAWEPELSFEVHARLLKLLRAKAQRSDADKPALARRMDTLLAALVASDPARAAVLCP